MDREILRLDQVSKKFYNQNVLTDINMSIYEGECVALLGKNGAGKSTLLNLILGLYHPTSGEIKNDYTKKDIGFLSQESRFPHDVKVNEMLKFIASFSDNPLTEIEINHILDFSIEQKNKFIYTLSGGQRRLLDVCLALLNRPKFLVIDEPTAGMDTSTRRHFWNIVHEMKNKGTTILYTTHYLEEVDYCADKVILLEKGLIKAMDTPFHLRMLNNKKCLSVDSDIYLSYQNVLESEDILNRVKIIKEKDKVSWYFDNDFTNIVIDLLLLHAVPLNYIELKNASLLTTLFDDTKKKEKGESYESVD
ncbi:MAG: ABC transporter ATP-binding protein [Vagococcus sp.]